MSPRANPGRLNLSAIGRAKLTPPVIGKVLPRKRLFRQLNLASYPFTWIVGPAGAGKTTLTASFLQATKRVVLWYRIDSGDADLSGFVYYLQLALQRIAPRSKGKLPLLTPEYQHDLPAFTRQFFEMLSTFLPPDIVLVFDDYHELPDNAPLHPFLAGGIRLLPNPIRVVILSRENPVVEFSRLRVDQRLKIIDWEMLQFREEETRQLIRSRRGGRSLSRKGIKELHDYTQGWIAGLVLSLTLYNRADQWETFPVGQIDQAAFGYFITEVFKGLDSELQCLLLRVALLPDFSMRGAAILCGWDQEKKVDPLVLKRDFIFRLEGVSARYSLHPMFRTFLLSQASQTLPPEELYRLQGQAAEILLDEDRPEPAVFLLESVKDWTRLTRLICHYAPNMLDQGRNETLIAWIEKIPEPIRKKDPWLLFFLGACWFPFDDDKSRELLTEAYHQFEKNNNLEGKVQAWALIVDTIVLPWKDFSPLDGWLVTAREELIPSFETISSGYVKFRLISGVFNALSFRAMDDPDIGTWVDHLEQMLGLIDNPSQRILAGQHLSFHLVSWIGDSRRAGRVINLMRPPRKVNSVTPLARIVWHFTLAIHCLVQNRLEDLIHEVNTGKNIAEQTGIHLMDFFLDLLLVYERCFSGDPKGSRRFLKKLEKVATPKRILEYNHYELMVAWTAFLEGDFIASAAFAKSTLKIALRSGGMASHGYCLLQIASALLFQRDKRDEAVHTVNQLVSFVKTLQSPLFTYIANLLQAWVSFESGNKPAGLEALRNAFALSREYDIINFPFMCGLILGPLYEMAIQEGIEIETVNRLKQEHLAILPPPEKNPEWSRQTKLTSLNLSPRQSEILKWVAKGKINEEIALILKISPRTVQKHLEHIFKKLGVETRMAASALFLGMPSD